jgi:hypothetical protein
MEDFAAGWTRCLRRLGWASVRGIFGLHQKRFFIVAVGLLDSV